MGRKKKTESNVNPKVVEQRVTRLRRSTRTDAAFTPTKTRPKRRKNAKNNGSDGLQTIQLEAIETEIINDIESSDNHVNDLMSSATNDTEGTQKRNDCSVFGFFKLI